MSETPEHGAWYAGGLRFECTRCGRCCTGGADEAGYVWVEREDVERLAAHLALSLDEVGRRHLRRAGARLALLERAGGECVFLRDGRCAVYDARPRQCVAFPFWPKHVASPAAWAAAADVCEGIRDDAREVEAADVERLRDLVPFLSRSGA